MLKHNRRRKLYYPALLGSLCFQGLYSSMSASTEGVSDAPYQPEKKKFISPRRKLQYEYGYGYGYGYGGASNENNGDEEEDDLDPPEDDCSILPCEPSPSPSESLEPSSTPSSHPTAYIWNIVEDEDGFLVSTCKNLAITDSTRRPYTETIDFVYYLYMGDVTLEDAEKEATKVESQLHEVLTKKMISCDGRNADFVATELSSKGEDTVDGVCSDVASEPSQSCWEVSAQTTATFAARLSESELLELFLEWIDESLQATVDGSFVLRTEFQGFKNVNVGDGKMLAGSDAVPSSNEISAFNKGNIPVGEESSLPLGSLALGLATTFLLLLSILAIRRRKQRQRAFIDYVNETQDLELETSPSQKVQLEHQAEVVDDDELFLDSEFEIVEGIDGLDHNSRTCSIDKCPKCQQLNAPLFVPVNDR